MLLFVYSQYICYFRATESQGIFAIFDVKTTVLGFHCLIFYPKNVQHREQKKIFQLQIDRLMFSKV